MTREGIYMTVKETQDLMSDESWNRGRKGDGLWEGGEVKVEETSGRMVVELRYGVRVKLEIRILLKVPKNSKQL